MILFALIVMAAFCQFRTRAHRQLLTAKEKILENYRITREFSVTQKKSASFYFAKELPATIHANYPGQPGAGSARWDDLVKPIKLYGTRFRERVHIQFNADGSVRGFYSEKGGDQIPDSAHPIPEVVLYNRIGEEIRFTVTPDGNITASNGVPGESPENTPEKKPGATPGEKPGGKPAEELVSHPSFSG